MAVSPQKIKSITNILKSKKFTPHPKLSNRHFQTIFGVLAPGKKVSKKIPVKRRLFTMRDKDRIATDCSWQRNQRKHTTILIIHGLTGSSKAGYVRSIASKAFIQGFNVIRINLRNAGGTESLSKKLYHAGQSYDVNSIVRELIRKDKLKKIIITGFSLSGNICLKLAGEWSKKFPKQVKSIAVISPLIDLHASEPYLNSKENRFYRKRLFKTLRTMIANKSKYFPEYSAKPMNKMTSFREFDDYYHSKYSEFKSANDYYTSQSAKRLLSKIRLPTLIIHSKDDTIVPIKPLKTSSAMTNPKIITLITKHGGHCGFLGKSCCPGDIDARWAENRVLEFFSLILK
jgi:uncharacterized protein